MKILVVDDDHEIVELLSIYLKNEGYEPIAAYNGKEALTKLSTTPDIALMILDVMMPNMSGIDVVKEVRKDSDIPIIIVSAKTGDMDKIQGLITGADDYVSKPFQMAELLARMRAVLRRKGGTAAPVLSNGVVTLDPATKEACANDGPQVQLSNREFSLLQALLVRPGAILSRSELEDRIYGWGEEVESNAVEYLIHALRRKLGGEVIKNVRGVGWRVSKIA